MRPVCVPQVPLSLGPALSVVEIPSVTPLKNTDSSPSGSCYTWRATWLVGRLHAYLPLLPPGILSGLSLFRSCACSHSLCKWGLWCLEKTVSLQQLTTSGSHSLSFLHRSEPYGKGCDKDVPFRAEGFKGSHCLRVVWLWVSVWITIYCKRKLLWRGLSNALV